MSGLLVQTGQFEIDSFAAARKPPAMREISGAARFFTESLEYTPDNPWALEGAGALDLAKMRASRIPRQAHAAARDAAARFRLALAQRPTSPMLWANLALAKLHLDEIDNELLTALRHADELGPWEPTAQQTVLFVGLAAWRKLDPATRLVLEGTVSRGAVRNTVKMYAIAKSYARFDLVCAIEKYRAIAGADCNSAGRP